MFSTLARTWTHDRGNTALKQLYRKPGAFGRPFGLRAAMHLVMYDPVVLAAEALFALNAIAWGGE